MRTCWKAVFAIALSLNGQTVAARAYGQELPTISDKMVSITATFSADNGIVVQQKGAFALTSIAFGNDGPKAVKVQVLKLNFSGSDCRGYSSPGGRQFRVYVPSKQTIQLTYPTPLAFFADQTGSVCLSLQVATGQSGNIDVHLVGYTQ